VDLGIAGIGAQPVNRPSLDLARRKDQVHWAALIWGRADVPEGAGRRAGDRIGIRDMGKNEKAREGIPAGAILRLSSYQ
jgi:hypothetical protein